MDFSAKLSLPYLLPNQAQKHVTMNESLRALDAILQLSVISASEPAPPDAPDEGDRYIVAVPATGEWAGANGQIAAFQDGAWALYTPQAGWIAWVEGDAQLIVFDGNDWAALTGAGSETSPEQLGINATADGVNRLAVRSAASLFSHEGEGHQLKINKASETDTASILFQTDYSGRAEIGLTGSDDFLLKTSADGQNFVPMLLARPSNGNVGIGTWAPTAKLHVEGALRLGVAAADELPDAASVGAGGLMFQRNPDSTLELLFSDGAVWRSVTTGNAA